MYLNDCGLTIEHYKHPSSGIKIPFSGCLTLKEARLAEILFVKYNGRDIFEIEVRQNNHTKTVILDFNYFNLSSFYIESKFEDKKENIVPFLVSSSIEAMKSFKVKLEDQTKKIALDVKQIDKLVENLNVFK